MNKIHKVEKNSLSLLTGKCRDAFEGWLDEKYGLIGCLSGYYQLGSTRLRKDLIFELPFSMQYGVMVDFFDKNRIEIDCRKDEYEVSFGQDFMNDFGFKTRQEAREQAIKAANNLFNER